MTLVTLAGKAHAEIAPFGRRRARDIKTSRPLSPCLGEKGWLMYRQTANQYRLQS